MATIDSLSIITSRRSIRQDNEDELLEQAIYDSLMSDDTCTDAVYHDTEIKSETDSLFGDEETSEASGVIGEATLDKELPCGGDFEMPTLGSESSHGALQFHPSAGSPRQGDSKIPSSDLDSFSTPEEDRLLEDMIMAELEEQENEEKPKIAAHGSDAITHIKVGRVRKKMNMPSNSKKKRKVSKLKKSTGVEPIWLATRPEERPVAIDDLHREKLFCKFRLGDNVRQINIARLKKIKLFKEALEKCTLETSPGRVIILDETDVIELGDDVPPELFHLLLDFVETSDYSLSKIIDKEDLEDPNSYIRVSAHAMLFELAKQFQYTKFQGAIYHKMQTEKNSFLEYCRNLPEMDLDEAKEHADQKAIVLQKWQSVRERTPSNFKTFNWTADENPAQTSSQAIRGWRYRQSVSAM